MLKFVEKQCLEYIKQALPSSSFEIFLLFPRRDEKTLAKFRKLISPTFQDLSTISRISLIISSSVVVLGSVFNRNPTTFKKYLESATYCIFQFFCRKLEFLIHAKKGNILKEKKILFFYTFLNLC